MGGERKKKTTGAISHASKLCQSHWSLGETVFVTYGVGESWLLCLFTAVCVCVFSLQGSRCAVACEDGRYFNGQDCQPCHRFCATCAGTFSPSPLVYPSGSGLAFVYLSLSITHANPFDIFKINAGEAWVSSDNHACILRSQTLVAHAHWKLKFPSDTSFAFQRDLMFLANGFNVKLEHYFFQRT